jgi:hypothetical protein
MSVSSPGEIATQGPDGRSSRWPTASLRRVREVFKGATSISEKRWAWIGAIAGVVFVLALLLSKLMIPNPPAIDAGVSVITTYFSAYAGTLIASGLIGTCGAVVFLIFLGVVHKRHALLNDDASGSVLLAAGTVFAAVGAVAAIATTTLAILAEQSAGLPADSYVSAAYVLSTVVGTGVFGLVAGVVLVVFSVALLAERPLNGGIGALVLLLGLVNAIGGGAALVISSYSTPWMVVQTIGLFGVAFAVLAVSLTLPPLVTLAGAAVHSPEDAGVVAMMKRRLGLDRVASYGRVLSGVALFVLLALVASIAVPLTTRSSDVSLLAAAATTPGASTPGASTPGGSSSSASVGYDGAAICAPTTDAATSGGSPQALMSTASQVASGSIEGQSWSLWSAKGQTGASALENGGLVFNGREYGLCPGYPNPSETEMIATNGDAIIYGVVNYPGPATVHIGTGEQGFTMDTTLPSPQARVVNGVSFYIGTLPKSACDYSYLVINTSSGSYTAQHNIGFGTNGAGQGYSITNNPGNVGACLPGKLDPLSFSQGQWSPAPPTTPPLP